MSSIIQPIKELVNTKQKKGGLSQQSAQLQEKLMSRLFEIYKELNIVFMGTPDFAVPILKSLLESDFKPKAVITAPDKPTGRKQEITASPVKIFAQENKIPIFQPENKEALVKETLGLKPDLIIVAAYGKILPKQILDFPKYGTINVHPSLLPKYRGPSPVQFAILNGEAETGVSIMLMNEKMDEGAILAQQIVQIEKDENAQNLEKRLAQISAQLLVRVLNHWIILKEMPEPAQRLIYPQEQDDLKATYTKIITKHDGKIIWDKSAEEIERQIRAFYSWPGSYAFLESKTDNNEAKKAVMIKIISAGILLRQTEKQLGEIFVTENTELAVQTGKNCLLIKELQIEGGKPMNAADFLNGHPEVIGKIFQ